jgi:signal transduction histidine kinase/CheY-like chemotaxis protein
MARPQIQSREDGYTQADLHHLRLNGLPVLVVIQYVAALAFTTLPIATPAGERYWASVGSAFLGMAVLLLREWKPSIAAAALVGSFCCIWSLILVLSPGIAIVCLGVLIIGAGSSLFGVRATFLLATYTSLMLTIGAIAGRISIESLVLGVIVNWAGASLFWLTARPAYTTLAWAWSSYIDAAEKHEQLRQQHGELARVLKSLDLAYRRLEHLNDELNRARHVAEEARRLKSEFAASISHELRTPLNLILGFSEMMVRRPKSYGDLPLPPAFQADIDTIYRNARHLASLIDDVLDLSQIEAGRLGLMRENADLREVVEEAVRAVSPRLAYEGLSLTIALPENLPPVFLDRTRIRQVLINLLNNAARFTDVGGVRISAECRDHDLVVSVADTGVGIPPDELPHVFDEFFQAGSALQRRVGGSGLGLTISKRIVELHGGAMWAESRVGEGSTFFFSLPLTRNVATGTVAGEWTVWDRVAQGPERTAPALGLIADEEMIIRTFQRYLDGYRIIPAIDAAHLARLADEMPLRGAIIARTAPAECWRILREIVDRGFTFPIAVATISGRHRQAAALGVADYLDKPILREQVGTMLERLGKRVRTILVVDDNADMVRLLARMISGFGRRYDVWQATSGQEALVIMRRQRPDALVLDLLMPEIDGYAVLAAMQADDRLRGVPVVAISSGGAGSELQTGGIIQVTRSSGFSTTEIIQCLKGCFDALGPAPEGLNAPVPPVTRAGSPVSAGPQPLPGSEPAPLPGARNR